jgi:hypothetical protein
MSRWRAFSTHLLLSVAVVGLVAAIALLLWFPPELIRLSRIDRLIGLIASVHIVVGPVITLIIFKPGKPGLRFDLRVIAFLQCGLLAYGIWVLVANRPIFMVWVGDRYELVTSRDLLDADLELAPAEYRLRSWSGPVHVAAPLPEDAGERQALLLASMEHRDIHLQPRYYRPFGSLPIDERTTGQPLALLLASITPAERAALLERAGDRDIESLRFLPVTNAARDAALMLIDSADGKPLGVVDIDPWQVQDRARESS